MRPKIILYCDAYGDRVSQALTYVDFFQKFGEVILVTPSNDLKFWMDHADVLALPGGADVDPRRYGERPGPFMANRTNPHYEFLDEFLLTPWLNTGKPIIGICRGLQTLNVAAGGSLHQHVSDHVLEDKKGRGEPTHDVYTDFILEIEDDVKDFRIHPVNSFHHQAIKQMAPGFEMIGWSTIYKNCPSLHDKKARRHSYIWERFKNKDGAIITRKEVETYKGERRESSYVVIPEIIRHKEKPYIAFQYHPEEFNDELANALIWKTLQDSGLVQSPYNVSIIGQKEMMVKI